MSLPPELQHGHVVGRFLLAIADGDDPDRMPDAAIPADLKVEFSPKAPLMRVGAPNPVTVVKSRIACALDATGRLIDPKGADGVRLVTGQYSVKYQSASITVPPHDIEVLATHTEAAPLDLTIAMPPGGPILTPSQYTELNNRLLVVEAGGGGGVGGDGASAYEVAVANGYVGTEAQWLDSLVGPAGGPGVGVPQTISLSGSDLTLSDGGGTVTLPSGGGGGDGVDIKVGGSAPASGWWLASDVPEYDPTAPNVPTGLAAAATGATTVQLTWVASTDNIAVTGYEYRIGSESPVDAGANTSVGVGSLSASTSYSFEVRAYDAAGNRSGWSTPAEATTLTAAEPAAPIASDDFNRANSSAGGLGTTSIGGRAWVDPVPNWSIQSNRAGSTTLGGGFALIDAGTPNVRVEADITLIDESRGANEQVNLIFRRGSSDADASHHIRLTVIAESMKLQVMEPDQDILDDDAKVIYTFPTPFGVNDTRRVGCVLKEVAGSTQIELLYEGAVVLTRTTSRSTRPVTGNFVGLHNGWDRFHVDNYTVWEA